MRDEIPTKKEIELMDVEELKKVFIRLSNTKSVLNKSIKNVSEEMSKRSMDMMIKEGASDAFARLIKRHRQTR